MAVDPYAPLTPEEIRRYRREDFWSKFWGWVVFLIVAAYVGYALVAPRPKDCYWDFDAFGERVWQCDEIAPGDVW